MKQYQLRSEPCIRAMNRKLFVILLPVIAAAPIVNVEKEDVVGEGAGNGAEQSPAAEARHKILKRAWNSVFLVYDVLLEVVLMAVEKSDEEIFGGVQALIWDLSYS